MEAFPRKISWREVRDSNDVDNVMYLFGRFHDSCIREIHVATGHAVGEDLSMQCDWRTTVHLLVQRPEQRILSAIELKFEKVVELRLSPPPPDHVSVISECFFTFQDGICYWSDDERFKIGSREPNDYSWVAARRVWWRDASQWMGAALRYKSDVA